MNRVEALALLSPGDDDFEDPVYVPEAALRHLSCEDLGPKMLVGVGETIGDVTRIVWDGHFFRIGNALSAHCEYSSYRKYWDGALGMAHYLDLVRRSVEMRQRVHADVELLDWDDEEETVINLVFEIHGLPTNLADAYEKVLARMKEFEEPAEEAMLKAGAIASEVGQRISGWGATPLDKLVEFVEKAKTSDDKGRSLEELVARLFGAVPGLTINGRVKTETEEIDITILNGSDDARFRRESALLLVECKNWSSKCGKNEFVLFKEKLVNRKSRCSLGFLVSWNGFAETIPKEMLRGSREEALIVPVTGRQIREMVRTGRPLETLGEAWLDAVHI